MIPVKSSKTYSRKDVTVRMFARFHVSRIAERQPNWNSTENGKDCGVDKFGNIPGNEAAGQADLNWN
jgi:hypothetical protein